MCEINHPVWNKRGKAKAESLSTLSLIVAKLVIFTLSESYIPVT